MAGSWQAAKRAVESHFTDKCRVTEFTEEETSWGETRFSAVQGKEMTCRLVEEGDGSDIEGLLAYGKGYCYTRRKITLWQAVRWK